MNIPTEDFLLLTSGEMGDLIACYQISQGIAKEAKHEKFIPDLR